MNRWMIKLMSRTWLIAVVVVMVVCGGGQANTLKVGVFDIQEVVDTIPDGKQAKSDMESALAKRKQDLDKRQVAFRKLEADLDRQKLVLSGKALDDKRREVEEKGAELQRAAMEAQMEMQKLEMDLRGGIIKKIQAVVEKIGQQGKYDMIFEKQEAGMIFVQSTYNITSAVVSEYNKAYGKR